MLIYFFSISLTIWLFYIRGLVLGLTCLLDRFMYGKWILVPLNFLKFNFLSSGGDYYGTHKWHWYFTQGFTVMIFTHLPFSIAGIIYSKQWKFAGLIAWVLVFYSVLGHKEFRYINLICLHLHVNMQLTHCFSWVYRNNNNEVQVCLASSSYCSYVLWLFFSCNEWSTFLKKQRKRIFKEV